jgi:hypothetical protein
MLSGKKAKAIKGRVNVINSAIFVSEVKNTGSKFLVRTIIRMINRDIATLILNPVAANFLPSVGSLIPKQLPILMQTARLRPIGKDIRVEYKEHRTDIADKWFTLIHPAMIQSISNTKNSIAVMRVLGRPKARYYHQSPREA